MSQFKPSGSSFCEESKKNCDNPIWSTDPNKLKQKILSTDSLNKLPFELDDDLLEEDEDDEKPNHISSLTESFILINKENLGEGSSRSNF